MAFDSPHIFSSCYFRSFSSSSYPWLVALWCLSVNNTSLLPLPRVHSLSGMGYFGFFGSLHIFLTFFIRNHKHDLSLFAWILISSTSPASYSSLFDFFPTLWGSLHPCCSQRSLPIFFLTCPPSLLCCSMGNTGNHGEQVCDIHGDLAVVRYEQCLCLLACRGLNWWRDIFVFRQFNIYKISPKMLSL